MLSSLYVKEITVLKGAVVLNNITFYEYSCYFVFLLYEPTALWSLEVVQSCGRFNTVSI